MPRRGGRTFTRVFHRLHPRDIGLKINSIRPPRKYSMHSGTNFQYSACRRRDQQDQSCVGKKRRPSASIRFVADLSLRSFPGSISPNQWAHCQGQRSFFTSRIHWSEACRGVARYPLFEFRLYAATWRGSWGEPYRVSFTRRSSCKILPRIISRNRKIDADTRANHSDTLLPCRPCEFGATLD